MANIREEEENNAKKGDAEMKKYVTEELEVCQKSLEKAGSRRKVAGSLE